MKAKTKAGGRKASGPVSRFALRVETAGFQTVSKSKKRAAMAIPGVSQVKAAKVAIHQAKGGVKALKEHVNKYAKGAKSTGRSR